MALQFPAVARASINPFAKKPPVELKIVSLTFQTDHTKMLNHTADWMWGSSSFSKPEWLYGKQSQPISHTMDKPVSVEIEVEVWPLDADETAFDITGDGAFAGVTFTTSAKLKGGKHKLRAKTTGNLPKKVARLDGDIAWSAKDPAGKSFPMGPSAGHEIYLTMDTPIDVPDPEKGVNLRRMRAAVKLVGGTGSLDPHTIVSELFKKFRFYALVSNPVVPHGDPPGSPDYNHPWYFNRIGGAWPMSEFMSASGECQAIVRFVRAVIKQVGCPGTAETVVVWADPEVDNGNTPKVDLWENGGGLNDKNKTVAGKQWFAYLVDSDPVRVGQVFDTDDDSSAKYIGLNNFEACLRFTHAGVIKFYAGGTGGAVFDKFEDVIKVFKGLCWVTIQGTKPNRKARIEQIVKKY